MSDETIRTKAEELESAATEESGDATDNEALEAEGTWQRNKAQAEQQARNAEKRFTEQTKRDLKS